MRFITRLHGTLRSGTRKRMRGGRRRAFVETNRVRARPTGARTLVALRATVTLLSEVVAMGLPEVHADNRRAFFEIAENSGWFPGRTSEIDLTNWNAFLAVDWTTPAAAPAKELLREFWGLHIPAVALIDPALGEHRSLELRFGGAIHSRFVTRGSVDWWMGTLGQFSELTTVKILPVGMFFAVEEGDMHGMLFAAERMGKRSLLWGNIFDPFLNEFMGDSWIDVVARSYSYCSEPADHQYPEWE